MPETRTTVAPKDRQGVNVIVGDRLTTTDNRGKPCEVEVIQCHSDGRVTIRNVSRIVKSGPDTRRIDPKTYDRQLSAREVLSRERSEPKKKKVPRFLPPATNDDILPV